MIQINRKRIKLELMISFIFGLEIIALS